MAETKLKIISEFIDKGVKEAIGAFGKLKPGLTAAAGGVLAVGAVAGGALVAGLTAATNVAVDFQDATNAIIVGTGASGKTLAGMENIVKSLAGSTGALGKDFGTLGAVVAEVNTRTGATDKQLEDFSNNILNMSRLTGGDAVGSVKDITRVMGDWGIGLDDSAELMDKLFGAGQAFGIGTDALSQKLVQFGAPLRTMGFSLEESIALLGKWEKEGVNTELVLGSLRIAAGHFADAGIDMRDGLNETISAIQNAETESEGLAIAMDVFGARAGPDMAAAIREGRFEIEDAAEALNNTAGGLQDAADRSLTLTDLWDQLKNQATVSLLPIGQEILPILSDAIGTLGVFLADAQPFIDNFAAAFGSELADALPRIGEALLSIGQSLGFVSTDGPAATEAVNGLASALDGIVGGVEAVAQLAEDLAEVAKLAREVVDWLDQLTGLSDVASPSAGLFGNNEGGSFLGIGQGEGGLFGRGGVLGFQHGGSFTVGGAGGPDSQLVMFRASPGETVSVNTPSQNNIPGIDTGRVSGAVMQAAQKIAGQMLKQFENDLVRELSR